SSAAGSARWLAGSSATFPWGWTAPCCWVGWAAWPGSLTGESSAPGTSPASPTSRPRPFRLVRNNLRADHEITAGKVTAGPGQARSCPLGVMAVGFIPEELQRFLARNIECVDQLEI